MAKQNIKRRFFLSLMIVLIIWFSAGFVFQITRNQIKKTEVLLADTNLQTSEKEEIKSLANQIKVLDDKIQKTEKFFLGGNQEDLVGFIETLESMSESVGINLTIKSIEVKKIDDIALADNFENLDLKLEAKGNWRGVLHFLYAHGSSAPKRVSRDIHTPVLRQQLPRDCLQ